MISSHHLTYGDGPLGSRALRSALSVYFNDRFNPFKRVQPDQIIVTSGVTGILDLISLAITDDGDGFLVGRPVYHHFSKDLTVRAKAKMIPVSSEGKDPMGEAMVEQFEKELLKQKQGGINVKAIVLSKSVILVKIMLELVADDYNTTVLIIHLANVM